MAVAVASDMFSATEQRAAAIEAVEERLVSQAMGRGLFAAREFKEDEIIFEEIPIVSCQFVYNKQYGYRACDHCLRSLESAESNVRRLTQEAALELPYPQCADLPLPSVLQCSACQAEFCSEECRSTAWQQYHQLLCHPSTDSCHPLALLLHEWKQQHFPPETLSILLPARLLAGVLQSSDRVSANSALANFCSATVSTSHAAAHKLLGPEFAQHINVLRTKMQDALGDPDISHGIASSPLARWVSRTDDLMLKAADRAQLDTFIDQLYEKLDSTVGSFLNTEGSGLYRLQSRINHSCRPNANVSFPHNCHRLQVTALRNIEPGEQLFISYLDECELSRSRHSRQKTLKENYVFTCCCERCLEEQEQPDVTSDEDMDEDDSDDMAL
ncbi:SET domain [Trinorchestia longiramus]|nr:SET domain [Trinorchestia longiramus]